MSSKKFIILNLFSKRLKELIELRLKITQKAFADRIGVTESYLSMVLNENSGPSADMIAGLYLHCNEYLTWLMTGIEAQEPSRVIAEFQTAYGGEGHKCKFCGDMSDEIKDLCKKVKGIIESDEKVIVDALKSNIEAFRYSVSQADEIRKLKETVNHHTKLLQADTDSGTGKDASTGTRRKKM